MTLRRPRAEELLRSLLVASIVIPAAVMATLAWVTQQAAFINARHELVWTSEVAREHAAKVFDSYGLVADRVSDLLGTFDPDAVRRSEDRLSRQFKAMVAGLPQIASLIVLDRTGHLLVATDANPVDRSTDFSDRDYFQSLRDGGAATYVSRVQVSRVTGKRFFGRGRARRDATGTFGGVIDIAGSPAFLQGFYATLVSEVGQSAEGRIVTMLREDGQVLARSPAVLGDLPTIPRSNPFFAALRTDPDKGVFTSRSVMEAGAPERLYAFRTVPGSPIYIVAGRSMAAIRAEWARAMLRYLAIGVPGTAVLFLLTLATVRGARRERDAHARVEMSRREAAEAQLRQSQKMEAIGQLTGGIAHDFNNLLTVIRASVDLLRRSDLPDARRDRYVAAISDAADRAAKLTGQFLAFARRQALRPEVFDVAGKAAAVAGMVRTLIGPRVAVETRFPDGPLFADADTSQFDACMVNLAVNARDAMGGQGRLPITVSAVADIPAPGGRPAVRGEHVAVAVEDTGIGIPAERIEAIFTTKPKGEGTGLGLGQVFGFAEQSGGRGRSGQRAGPRHDLHALPAPGDGPGPSRRGDRRARHRARGSRRLRPGGRGRPGRRRGGDRRARGPRLCVRAGDRRRAGPGRTRQGRAALRRGVLRRGHARDERHRTRRGSPPPLRRPAGRADQRLQRGPGAVRPFRLRPPAGVTSNAGAVAAGSGRTVSVGTLGAERQIQNVAAEPSRPRRPTPSTGRSLTSWRATAARSGPPSRGRSAARPPTRP